MDNQPLPTLTERDVRLLCTERSFERGEDYYWRGAIREPVRQGNTLRALCEGSQYEPYRVMVELDAMGVARVDCSCPYDWGGCCKHIVALLLTWIRNPEKFAVIPETEELLAEMDREELIELIKAMLEQEPELIYLLERRQSLTQARKTPVDPEVYRRQVAYAFGRGVDWDEVPTLASELRDIRRIADQFRKGGDWANAWAIYKAIAEEAMLHYEEVHDEGYVAGAIAECIEGMADCLREGLPSSQMERQQWIRELFRLYLTDVDWGGYGLTDSVPDVLAELAQGEDGPFIEKLFREAISQRQGNDWSSRWHREQLLRHLLLIYESQGREGDYLNLCWEEGFDLLYAQKLLELGRLEEALRAAREGVLQPQEVLQFSQALWDSGHQEEAISIAWRGLQRSYEDGLAGWLADRQEERGELSAALALQLRRFESRPTLERYLKVKGLAEALGRGGEVTRRLITLLEQEEEYGVLIEIYLQEGEIDRAIEAVGRLQGYYVEPYLLRVAEAAEESRPRQAIAFYQDLANRQIAHTNRKAYRAAAGYLSRAKALYQRLGKEHQWRSYIADLRAQYPRHRALQDELNRAGL